MNVSLLGTLVLHIFFHTTTQIQDALKKGFVFGNVILLQSIQNLFHFVLV